MDWIRFEPALLRTPEFSLAKPRSQMTWITLLCHCAEQENGGVLEGAAHWSDDQWVAFCRVRRAAVLEAAPLLVTVGDDVVVWAYPASTERNLKQARSAGLASAEAKRKAKSVGHSVDRSVKPSVAPSVKASVEPPVDTEEGGRSKEIQNTPLTPLKGGAGQSGALPTLQPEPVRSRMLALNTLTNRRAGTAWSEQELEWLRKSGLLGATEEEFAADMDVMAAFCAQPDPPDTAEHARNPLRFRRVGLLRKLKNWADEGDKARAWAAAREAARVAALPPSDRKNFEAGGGEGGGLGETENLNHRGTEGTETSE